MTMLSASFANAKVSCKRLMPYLLAEEVYQEPDHRYSKSSIGVDSLHSCATLRHCVVIIVSIFVLILFEI